ncbi:unnamed protein product [Pleuronectes platessa]|uniref:Uncharacterized protein n=1 Tax=Pleuronectes platessa TaxID=8262 RepID=A0A9N7VZ23_PLEPL|nr:unnamed protein product [Pleuronectes platessa]
MTSMSRGVKSSHSLVKGHRTPTENSCSSDLQSTGLPGFFRLCPFSIIHQKTDKVLICCFCDRTSHFLLRLLDYT